MRDDWRDGVCGPFVCPEWDTCLGEAWPLCPHMPEVRAWAIVGEPE